MSNEQVYDFGVRLRQLREERGLSRSAFARKLGVSTETVYRYENNIQAPSLERTKQIAIILRTSIDYLVGFGISILCNGLNQVKIIHRIDTEANRFDGVPPKHLFPFPG